jgi:hypothetical protein
MASGGRAALVSIARQEAKGVREPFITTVADDELVHETALTQLLKV